MMGLILVTSGSKQQDLSGPEPLAGFFRPTCNLLFNNGKSLIGPVPSNPHLFVTLY